MMFPNKIDTELEALDVIYARFEPEFISKLLEVWPDPENGKSSISEPRFAQLCDLSQGAVYKYLHNDRYPDSKALRKIGEFFGLYFVEDYDKHIDNNKILKLVKTQHS